MPTQNAYIQKVSALDWGRLRIPEYQRPYSWTPKNVNDFISDIKDFSSQSDYRFGSLVLHNNGDFLDIVDGQQRITTLALLLGVMGWDDANYKKFCRKLRFADKVAFDNALRNKKIVTNRISEVANCKDFVLNKCEFVVFVLDDISEAFQFFDSQNSRGKALMPHDLLKAYHLREVAVENGDAPASSLQSKNLKKWHDAKGSLQDLFLKMYRAKRWANGLSARSFTSDDIAAFKGYAIDFNVKQNPYPYMQMEVMARFVYDRRVPQEEGMDVLEYPYNLDDQMVNGAHFFDMVRHYLELQTAIAEHDVLKDLFENLQKYDGANRIGDKRVLQLFESILFYFADRFGVESLTESVCRKMFVWAYSIRVSNHAVLVSTIDNAATAPSSLFRFVHESNSPRDLQNIVQAKPAVKMSRGNYVVELINKYLA